MRRLNLKLIVTTTTVFAALVYLICVISRPILPNWPMHALMRWEATFPGFSWTLGGVLLGFLEIVLFAAAAAALFVGLYNFFAARLTPTRT